MSLLCSGLSCFVLRSVALFLTLFLFGAPQLLHAQQEGRYLFFRSKLKIEPQGLSTQAYFPYAPVVYDTINDEIFAYNTGYHVDCDSAGVDMQESTILTRAAFAPGVNWPTGVYLDTSGVGNTMAFPDRSDPNLLHALMPTKQTFPDYAMVQQLNLVTYNRLNYTVLRNVTLADSMALGAHQVIRHHNRRDYWLVGMRSLQNNWYQPLVWSVRGMQLIGPISQPPVYIHAYSQAIFQNMLQSPDENHIVVNTSKGAFTLFKFNRETGVLHSRLPVDLQRIFYRPYAGDLFIRSMNFSPAGDRLYLFTIDFRSYPFRNRMYQFDLTVWDSLAVTQRFYNYQTLDTAIYDFMPASNNRVYLIQQDVITDDIRLAQITDPDSNWGLAALSNAQVSGSNLTGGEIGLENFWVTRAHYSHPKRYRFSATAGCAGDSIHFRMNEIRNMTHVMWEMGDGVIYSGDSLYDPGHVYQAPGRFLVKATAQFCGQTVFMEDSLIVAGPPTNYLPDTVICDGSTFEVNAFQPLALSEVYRWRDGDTNAIRNIDRSGWWWVDVQGPCGSFRDSFYVSYTPEPLTGLPVDTFFCPGTQGFLEVETGTYRWIWPDSSTAPQYAPRPDESSVTIQLENHCGRFTETVQIHQLEIPNFAAIDTVLCPSLPYIADFSWDNYTHIRWEDGDTSQIREIRKAFDSGVNILHPCGDSWIAVQLVRERCDCNLFLPTAFSPNGDGLNDSYAPVYDCEPQLFEMVVFDRWGKVIFQSQDASAAWNGTINGQAAEAGFYAVRVSLLGENSREMRRAGAAVLLRR